MLPEKLNKEFSSRIGNKKSFRFINHAKDFDLPVFTEAVNKIKERSEQTMEKMV